MPGSAPGTYDTCVLRLTPTGWDGARSSAGVSEPPSSPGEPSATLQDLFARNNSAAARYRPFARRDWCADGIDWTSGALLAVGLALPVIDGRSAPSTGMEAAGIALFLFGIPIVRNQAERELTSAIWWYNRELP